MGFSSAQLPSSSSSDRWRAEQGMVGGREEEELDEGVKPNKKVMEGQRRKRKEAEECLDKDQ